MTLYSKSGSRPVELPFLDRDVNGDVWTDLPDNPMGRAACNWVEAPQPDYNPLLQYLTWDNGSWHVHAIDVDQNHLEEARELALVNLAQIRWQHQQVMLFGGSPMPADDVTIGRCTAAESYARNKSIDLDEPRNWKVANGVFTTLTTNQIIAYGLAIGDHMQACFDHEKALTDIIVSATTIETINALDLTQGWPA